MPTTTDLRDLLHDRADGVSVDPPRVDAAIQSGRHTRARRRGGVAVAALGVAAAVALPTVVGWPSVGRAPSSPPAAPQPADRVTSPSGLVWAATVPGLDLPTGDALEIPYAFGTVVHDGAVERDLGGLVRQLVVVPQGLVALVDTEPEPPGGPHPPTRLLLVGADPSGAEDKEIDRGYVRYVGAVPGPGVATRLVWTWTDVATDPYSKEARSIVLGSGTGEGVASVAVDRLRSVHVEGGGDPLLEYGGEQPSVALWDLAAKALVPVDGPFPIASAPDQAVSVLVDPDTRCTSAVDADGAELWQRCDVLVQSLAPDGKVLLATVFDDGRIDHTAEALGVLDAASGTEVARLDLPPSGGAEYGAPETPAIEWYVLAWEPDGAALIAVRYEGLPGEDPDTNFRPRLRTMVRCDPGDGACEYVPDPVEVVATTT